MKDILKLKKFSRTRNLNPYLLICPILNSRVSLILFVSIQKRGVQNKPTRSKLPNSFVIIILENLHFGRIVKEITFR